MKGKIYLIILLAFCKSYSQTRRTEYINCAAFSNNVSCGVGELFIIQEFTPPKEVAKKPESEAETNIQSFFGYTNPVTDFFCFQTSVDAKSIEIYSIDGKLIKTEKLTSGNSIDLSYLKAGFYIIVFDNPKINQLKIIKN